MRVSPSAYGPFRLNFYDHKSRRVASSLTILRPHKKFLEFELRRMIEGDTEITLKRSQLHHTSLWELRCYVLPHN